MAGLTFPPVRLRRAAGTLPLPFQRREFMLVLAWLLATLQQGGPYPLLVIAGEQGSSKTVLTKILRALIGPNAAPTRAPPRGGRDLTLPPTTSSPSTICPACVPGPRMPFVGSPVGVVFPFVGCLAISRIRFLKGACSGRREP
jgi:hypothetical protein